MLSSLGTLTKSACQLILQTSIMMVTWHLEDTKTLLHVYRTANIIFSAMMLARSATINHYFVSSGKNVQGKVAILKQKNTKKYVSAEKLVKFSKKFKRWVFNILHVSMRGFVISLLASYLQFFIIAILGLMVLSNYILANCLIISSDRYHSEYDMIPINVDDN